MRELFSLGSIQRLRGKISNELRLLRKQRLQFCQKGRHLGIVRRHGHRTQFSDSLIVGVNFHSENDDSGPKNVKQYWQFCSLSNIVIEGALLAKLLNGHTLLKWTHTARQSTKNLPF